MARKKDITFHQKNPFMGEIAGMKTRRKRVTVSGGKVIVDRETGVCEDIAEIVSVHEVDNEQFVKVFTSQVKQFFNLTPSTFRLVQVLLVQLGKTPQRDTVYLNLATVERYFEETDQRGMSRSAYHGAMKELIVKSFIAESIDPNLYWINPSLFFNGDRVRFVKEYRNTEYKQGELSLDEKSKPALKHAAE